MGCDLLGGTGRMQRQADPIESVNGPAKNEIINLEDARALEEDFWRVPTSSIASKLTVFKL
jgi:hypothetical protein